MNIYICRWDIISSCPLTEAQMPREGARLRGHALLQAAVAAEHIREVVARREGILTIRNCNIAEKKKKDRMEYNLSRVRLG